MIRGNRNIENQLDLKNSELNILQHKISENSAISDEIMRKYDFEIEELKSRHR